MAVSECLCQDPIHEGRPCSGPVPEGATAPCCNACLFGCDDPKGTGEPWV